ncbi:hypothetical protein AVEN_151288-1 [Araneus ventricosus]|uniref:Uncharacterized protein n=1 Tax=Araneus ventricosus TaxID=182803 RepID=A0A4Y2PHJ7_ARAVE|nr:hypothetical protein AVEN_151288-1 [Araneus ventricosus]
MVTIAVNPVIGTMINIKTRFKSLIGFGTIYTNNIFTSIDQMIQTTHCTKRIFLFRTPLSGVAEAPTVAALLHTKEIVKTETRKLKVKSRLIKNLFVDTWINRSHLVGAPAGFDEEVDIH